MSQFTVQMLLDTGTVRVRDVVCSGECRHRSEEECTAATHLVFPYRGVFVRHVGRTDAVAEANQVLFFNEASLPDQPPGRGRRRLPRCSAIERGAAAGTGAEGAVAHGAALGVSPPAPAHRPARAGAGGAAAPQPEPQHRRNAGSRNPGADAGAARLGERTSHAAGASAGRQKLVDRAKLVLSADPVAALDAGRDRRRGRRFAGLSDAGVPAGRGDAALSLPAAPAAGARAGPAWPATTI